MSVFGQRKVEIIFDYYQDLTHPNTLVFLGFNHPNKLVEYTIYTSIGGGAITRNGHLLSDETDYYPFKDFSAIKAYCADHHIDLPTFVRRFERSANIDIDEYLRHVWKVMKATIKRGLETEGVLPGKLQIKRKAPLLHRLSIEKENQKKKKNGNICLCLCCYRRKCCGGRSCYWPTCGSSGVLPGCLYDQQVRCWVPDSKIVER